MAYDENWWQRDDHPDAKHHRKFLEREGKAAAERHLAAIPMRKPAPRRKAAAPSGSITRKEVDRMLFAAGKLMAGELAKRDARIAELEAAPPVAHKGPWRAGTTYPRNAMVQRSGSCWLSRVETQAKPGESPEAWRLIAKRGSAK